MSRTAKGSRLDRAVHAALTSSGRDVSMREVRSALEAGRLLVGGRRVKPGAPSMGGETIDATRFIPRAEARLAPEQDDRVSVLFEDETLLVLDKPSQMPCQPLTPYESGTLAHIAVHLCPAVADAGPPLEGGLLHRLDVETSGVVLLAKTRTVRDALRAAFTAHQIEKQYVAAVRHPIEPTVVRDPIEGQPAETALRMHATNPRWAVAVTRYGRRHQVRIHLAALGAPIDGDTERGGAAAARLMLHASRVTLPDGRTFESPYPEGFA